MNASSGVPPCGVLQVAFHDVLDDCRDFRRQHLLVILASGTLPDAWDGEGRHGMVLALGAMM